VQSLESNPKELERNSIQLEWPWVSVIILNYNGEHFIRRCLKTVLDDCYHPKEIILVDNASQDHSVDIAEEEFDKQIKIIKNIKNFGFPKGCNIGFRESKGDIIVLLNVDTAVRENWLYELVEPFVRDEKIGVTGSKLFFLNGKHIQFAGGVMEPNGLTQHEGYEMEDNPKFNLPKDVDYLTGASIAIRRTLLEYLGGLDEGFPLYYDDIDLCFTARRLGYRTLYRPSSVVLHFETFGTRKNSSTYYYKYHRGRIRFLLKHFGVKHFLSNILPAEVKWYGHRGFYKQFFPVLKAYCTQLPKAPYFWIRGWYMRRKKSSLRNFNSRSQS